MSTEPKSRLVPLCIGCGHPIAAEHLESTVRFAGLVSRLQAAGWRFAKTTKDLRCPRCQRDGDGTLRRCVGSKSSPGEYHVLRRARPTDPWICDCLRFHFRDHCDHVARAAPFSWFVKTKDPAGELLTSATYTDPDDVLNALRGFGCLGDSEAELNPAREDLYRMRLDEPSLDDLSPRNQPFFHEGTGTVITTRLSEPERKLTT